MDYFHLCFSLPSSRNGCGWLVITCEPGFTLPVALESLWMTSSRSYTTSSADMPRHCVSPRGKASPSWPIGMERSVPTLAPYRHGQWPHCSKCSTIYSSSVAKVIIRVEHCDIVLLLWKMIYVLQTYPEHVLDALKNTIIIEWCFIIYHFYNLLRSRYYC